MRKGVVVYASGVSWHGTRGIRCEISSLRSLGAEGITSDGPIFIENNVEPLLARTAADSVLVISPCLVPGIETPFYRFAKKLENIRFGRHVRLDLSNGSSREISSEDSTTPQK